MGLVDAADRAMRSGDVTPMIVIMPQGDLSYWVNHAYDGPRWGEYLVHDVVPYIDATYRTLRSPASRAVGGVSMGAWGALSNAFTHPEVFGVVGGHSVTPRGEEGSPPFLGTGADFQKVDPIYLASRLPSHQWLADLAGHGRERPLAAVGGGAASGAVQPGRRSSVAVVSWRPPLGLLD